MIVTRHRECKSPQEELNYLMRENKLMIHYQPIVDLKRGAIYGYEALTRFPSNIHFNHPAALFQAADEAGQLFQLEKHTRELAIESIHTYLLNQQLLWVNLTPNVIHDPSFEPGFTHSILKQTNLSPDQIVFELTEHSAISDFHSLKELLEHYRRQGFRVAIDDVGAGYSSLQMISELKPDFLKIDRSLITEIDHYREKQFMVEAIQHIGRKLGAGIIGEGVETEKECLHLSQMGISLMQGYYFAKPDYPPCALQNPVPDQVKQQNNTEWYPLKISEHTSFSDLMVWLSKYSGSYDHHFALLQDGEGKVSIPLPDIIKFAGSCHANKETFISPRLRSWLVK